MQLTKIDVVALRKCDNVSFHFVNGESFIDASRERKPDAPFSEGRHKIPVSQHVEMYGESPWQKELASAFEMLHCAQSWPTWQTFASLVRVGDELEFVWSVDGCRNQYMQDVDLHGDSLTIVIKRGDKRLSFLMKVGHCPNNSARMCQVKNKRDNLAA